MPENLVFVSGLCTLKKNMTSIRKVKFKTKKNNQANGCSLNNNKFFFGNISQIVNIFYKVNLKNLCSCVIIAVIALTFSSDNSG